ncbi:hypothetical protein VT84_10910 [Gemmata sp. SH-PL17]|nr:hypothetical protein VT84_10910 [Gemmata sp. SH-PL17]
MTLLWWELVTSIRWALAAGCLLVLAPAGRAVPVVGQAQPDYLPFGTVCVGGAVEGSFLVYASADDPKPTVKVEAPKFVKVLGTKTFARQVGAANSFTCVEVEVAIETAREGEFESEIKVTVGEVTTKMPVSVVVKTRKAGQIRLLVAGTPFECAATDSGKMYKAWTDLVRDAGLDTSYLLVRPKQPVLRDLDLSKYNCVLLNAHALLSQTADYVQRVRAFAKAGGRVVVTTSAFFTGSVPAANEVLDGTGLELLDQGAPRGLKNVTPKADDFSPEVVKAGIKSATFFRASPIRVENGGRVLVSAVGFEKAGLGFVATAKVGKGEVTVMGVSLWWLWTAGERGEGADNTKLLRWLLAPPLAG